MSRAGGAPIPSAERSLSAEAAERNRAGSVAPVPAPRLWLTWETQRRNRELAAAFGCRYARLDHRGRAAWARYAISAWRTLRLLAAERHEVVFAQCPSIVLAVLVALRRRLGGRFTYVIDAHNAALEYARSRRRLLRAAARFALRAADFVIVSNANLCDELRRIGGRPLILPDRLPEIPRRPLPDRFRALPRPLVTLISTYADDEPIETFLQAAQEVGEPHTLVVTGSRDKAGRLVEYESERLVFAGFLREEDFEGLIAGSDLLVDLTTREDCLVCGAYEAAAVGVPALLSSTAALRDTFDGGYLFARNERAAFTEALEAFLRRPAGYREGIVAFRERFARSWAARQEAVEQALADARRGGEAP